MATVLIKTDIARFVYAFEIMGESGIEKKLQGNAWRVVDIS